MLATKLAQVVRVRRLTRAFAAAPGFRCSACGKGSTKWQGQCGACGSWGSVAPATAPRFQHGGATSQKKSAVSVAWAGDSRSADDALSAVLRMNDVQGAETAARIKLPERELVRAFL